MTPTTGIEWMDSIRVRDVMTNLVVTVRPEDLVEQVAKRLVSNRISGAPVVEGGRLVGIVTEVDLVKAYWASGRRVTLMPSPSRQPRPTSTVGDVMTKSVVSIKPQASISEAASLIDRYGVRRLPVVDEAGFVIGVVARADLVRCMAQRAESTTRMPA